MFKLLIMVVGLMVLAACGSDDPTSTGTSSEANGSENATVAATATVAPTKGGNTIKQYTEPPAMVIDVGKEYRAIIKTNKGDIVIDLFASATPNTVNNFVFLAQDDYFDGIIFHRVIPNFMIQGGDPQGTGTGGPGYSFDDEIVSTLVFDGPGYLAMANRGLDGNGSGTNGSQFFITTVPTTHLNGKHTIFGKVVQGQDIADAISLVSKGPNDRPTEPIVIESIDIEVS